MENEFLTNYGETTFLDKIKKSLEKCNAFYFSVSFIKAAGLILIQNTIEETLKRGVKGRIITSTYQNFTDIPSLRVFKTWMEEYSNFECHLDYQCFGMNGFHSKGYLFEYDDSFEFIVGSSNITRFALLKNIEWNVSLKSKERFNSLSQAIEEFDYLWNKTLLLNEELIKTYQLFLDYAIEKWDMDYVDPISDCFKPNAMQRKALKELRRYRDMGVNKALIVSATGSGKTLLAAFDARNYEAKRLLFVVHRDKILADAKVSFSKVFGAEKTYGLFVGKHKDLGCDFVFASNIMLSQHLDEFDPHEFDYIVLDECHHAAAESYKKIIDYFKPGFMLGITATPERMDNKDVFELFDKNVPYELRLRDAIINDLVVPFRYYGIRDKLIDYSYRESAQIAKEVGRPENVDFIIKEINKHRPASKLKALAFCSSISHASLMAEAFTENGVNAVALTGVNDLGQRIKAFNDLQDDSNELEVICAVDILNEGVDIPAVNMVLFLRPTESSTIFLQQLGRGLRKYEGKQYVTVLDFIGNNYKRSIQIAMALSTLGTSTIIEKPYIRDLIDNDFKALSIPGVVIDIDELSKEEIKDFIDKENFNRKEFLMKDYENYKLYLKSDKYPLHMDYLNNDCSPDLLRFMKSKIGGTKNASYYSFMKKIGEDTIPLFNDDQVALIDKISDLLPLVRPDEYLIINQVLNDNTLNLNAIEGYNSKVTKDTLNNALVLLNKDGIMANGLLSVDKITSDYVEFVNDLLNYGLTRYEIEFGDYVGKFKLYGNYYKEQIQRIRLKEALMYMPGTEFPKDDYPYLYVGLNKTGIKKTYFDYKDFFKSPQVFQWESVKDTTFETGDGPKLQKAKKVHLFIRKKESEDGITLPFTYFGEGILTNPQKSTVDSVSGTHNTITYDVVLDNPVPKEYWFDFKIEVKEDIVQ